jgi:hypothetical protein
MWMKSRRVSFRAVKLGRRPAMRKAWDIGATDSRFLYLISFVQAVVQGRGFKTTTFILMGESEHAKADSADR